MNHFPIKMSAISFLLLAACSMPFYTVSAETEDILRGDVDGNGVLTKADATLLTSYLLGKNGLTSEQALTADYDQDNKLNITDLTFLKQELCKSIQSGGDVKGEIHTGYATFYGGGYEGGCAMLDPVSREDYWITAMNLPDWSCARLAGAFLEVTGELGTIQVLVTDLLPEGAKGDLDLYVDAFPLIAPAEKGKVPITWKIIPLDSAEDAPVSYIYKEGSSEFWCGVQVRNHRYPIEKFEYLDEETGEFIEIERRNYNFFETRGMGAGPFTFRITDIYGDVIIDEDIPLTPDEAQQGHVQFPL